MSQLLSSGDHDAPHLVKVELTDGWYTIQAHLDEALSCCVKDGKIAVGTKLGVGNALLVGSDDGIDPLDPAYSSSSGKCKSHLKLFFNTTRRARWDSKMGWLAENTCLKTKIEDSRPGGGNLGPIEVVIHRKYPKQFLETVNGRNTVLTEAEEFQARENNDNKRDEYSASELVNDEVEAEVNTNAPSVYAEMMRTNDPGEFYQTLGFRQQKVIDDWRERLPILRNDAYQKRVSARMSNHEGGARKSKPFVKLMVSTLTLARFGEIHSQKTFNLTYWDVSDDAYASLAETHTLAIKGATVKYLNGGSAMEVNVSRRTDIKTLGITSDDNLFASAFKGRSWLRSIKDFGEASLGARNTEVDICGVANKVVVMNNICCVYVALEEGKYVRLERENGEISDIRRWSLSNSLTGAGNSHKRGSPLQKNKEWMVRNVVLTGYDQYEGCHVVRWGRNSECKERDQNSESIVW